MTRRSGVDGVPADHVIGSFPAGRLTASAPPAARYAREIARALHAQLATRSVSGLARDAGLSRSTVQDLLAGRTWPDLVTLAKLETALGARLWPPSPPTS